MDVGVNPRPAPILPPPGDDAGGNAVDRGARKAPADFVPHLRFEPGLYHASPDVMLKVLKRATGETVMMLGHNPGIAEFAASLPARPPMDPEFRSYPTAATLVVDFQIDKWADLQPGQGSVMDFVRLDGR